MDLLNIVELITKNSVKGNYVKNVKTFEFSAREGINHVSMA